VVDQAVERAALVPDPLHHRVDRRGVADVDGMRADFSTEGLRRLLEHAAAAATDPELGAELYVLGGDFPAQPGAAAGDEDALTFEKAFFEHAGSRGKPAF